MPTVEKKGSSAFRYLEVTLEPGEMFVSEAGAMSSISPDIEVVPKLAGGFIQAILRRFLGNESLFITEYYNNTNAPQRLTLTNGAPGDVLEYPLNGDSIYLEPGTYLASTDGVKMTVRWAGIASFIGGEGLFKLVLSGTGKVWIGGYGAIIERQVTGEYLVDTGHLIAYQPTIRPRVQLAGGVFSSFFGGEGLVTRLEGEGKAYLQTRNIASLAKWINSHL